jgi:hypothetical protein
MCRPKSKGGRRCPYHSTDAAKVKAKQNRDRNHHERIQHELEASIGATPYREESGSLGTMSGRPSYYDHDEWIEYQDYLTTAAERHGLTVVDTEHAAGLWEGESEPAGAHRVVGPISNVREWAGDVAGRYNQDSVMVVWNNDTGQQTQYTFSAPDSDTDAALSDLQAAGIQGGRLVGNRLEIIGDDDSIPTESLEILSAKYGDPEATQVSAEFIEKNPAKSSHVPIKEIQMVRQLHAEKHDLPVRRPLPHLTDADDMAASIAWEKAEHQPDHPKLKRSYQTFTRHVGEQYNALTAAGYQFEPWHGETEQPYRNSAEMLTDLRDNKHLYYFRTEESGDTGIGAGHPMAKKLTVTESDGTERTIMANDAFRAVHDAIAHSEGHSFGPQGEKRAWWTHRSSLPREAHLALWNETRAQNVWTNAGPHMRATDADGNPRLRKPGEDGYLPVAERPFSDQKCVIVAKHFY